MDKEELNKREYNLIKLDTLLLLLGFVVQMAVVVGYFTRLENRLTKIETIVDIKVNHSDYETKKEREQN